MKKSLLRLATGLLLALPAASLFAADVANIEVPAEITERTLENGLKVVVWPDADIPNVALYTWYRAGGRNEYPGITGLAHYFEHMMFNGTKNLEPGEFDRIMEASGGANNAYTSQDVTVYQDWFPNSALETIMQLESDRMANLDFDPEVVESERGVVYSERRTSVDNNNLRALLEELQAAAFIAHPYQSPVIGWASDIENWKMQDLKDFYRTYYAPNNATMFVVGDVDPQRIFDLAETYFAEIPAQPAPEPITTVEPQQQGERRITLKRPAQSPLLQMAWHIPAAGHADRPALALLETILTDGDSSRLVRSLVEEQQLAISFGSYQYDGFDPGLAIFYATLPGDGDVAALEAAIDAELQRVIDEGVSQAELERARNVKLANFYRSIATISGKAQALGSFDTFHGDWRALFSAPDAYAAVTVADLQRVAREYFQKDNRTVGVLMPVDVK
ncbi:MAG: pitrilysin family protein [Gammaproteobacteria bacterium]|nr:pitrilysin family protein [Gammaproteobacteria bacterium]